MGEEIFGINGLLEYGGYTYYGENKYIHTCKYSNLKSDILDIPNYENNWISNIKSTLLNVIKDIDPNGEFISFKIMYYFVTFDCEIYNKEIEDSKLIFTVNKVRGRETIGKYQEIFRTNILKWVLSNKFNEESVTRVK